MLRFCNQINLSRTFQRYISTCEGKRSTIFALCSGSGKCGVAVFRISGPSSINVIKNMTEWTNQTFTHKQISLQKIYHPSSKEQIDRGLVLWFPGPNSFTGEDVCELQVHGGPAIIKQINKALSLLPDSRQALPGEFCKRSFENGKVDLTQVEGLADLLKAENEVQSRQALKLMEGHSSALYTKWADKLLKGMAHIEAFINFGEEEDMGDQIFLKVKDNMIKLMNDMGHHLKNGGMYERIRDGLNICIIGEPNVGKSSLLNTLCKRPVSIVTSHAGTTRDVIEVPFSVEGHQVVLSDTAGLRTNVPDEVERIGIERAYDRSKKSDIMILVVDSTSDEVESLCCNTALGSSSLESFIWNQLIKLNLLQDSETDFQRKFLLVFSKIDAAPKNVVDAINDAYHQMNKECITNRAGNKEVLISSPDLTSPFPNPPLHHRHKESEVGTARLGFAWCTASCCTENGLEELGTSLKQLVDELYMTGTTADHHSINVRHLYHIEKAYNHLKEFLDIISEPVSGMDTRLELSAEKLQGALHQVGCITGRITVDQILSQIFKDFCIGK